MEPSSQTVELGLQLAAAAGMMLVMTLVHGLGLVGISRALGLREDRLKRHHFNVRAVALMCAIALALLILHTAEIAIFAMFYWVVGAIERFEDALYYSASAYATLGFTADFFPQAWRLVGALEALIGFLMIGWSTAFIVSNVGELTPE
jgi:hypothetical protein